MGHNPKFFCFFLLTSPLKEESKSPGIVEELNNNNGMETKTQLVNQPEIRQLSLLVAALTLTLETADRQTTDADRRQQTNAFLEPASGY